VYDELTLWGRRNLRWVTHLRELGLERRAVDGVFRACPVVVLPGYSRPVVRVRDYLALLDESTHDGARASGRRGTRRAAPANRRSSSESGSIKRLSRSFYRDLLPNEKSFGPTLSLPDRFATTFLVARRYGPLPTRLSASAVTNAATSRICRSLSFPSNDGIAIPPRVTFSTVTR
jgi:hypothetical protein